MQLKEGANVLGARLVGPAGNGPTFEVPIELDTRPPSLDIQSPRENQSTDEDRVTVRGQSDPGAALSVLNRKTREERDQVVGPNGTFEEIVFLEPGENVIRIKVTDLARNAEDIERTVDRAGDDVRARITVEPRHLADPAAAGVRADHRAPARQGRSTRGRGRGHVHPAASPVSRRNRHRSWKARPTGRRPGDPRSSRKASRWARPRSRWSRSYPSAVGSTPSRTPSTSASHCRSRRACERRCASEVSLRAGGTTGASMRSSSSWTVIARAGRAGRYRGRGTALAADRARSAARRRRVRPAVRFARSLAPRAARRRSEGSHRCLASCGPRDPWRPRPRVAARPASAMTCGPTPGGH